jgi:hypothetical protein
LSFDSTWRKAKIGGLGGEGLCDGLSCQLHLCLEIAKKKLDIKPVHIAMVGADYEGLVSKVCPVDFERIACRINKDSSRIEALHAGTTSIRGPAPPQFILIIQINQC